MPIEKPGRRKALTPIGKLRSGSFGGGHKSGFVDLNLTPMVDMFTILVVFLLINFSSTGEILFMAKDMKLPEAEQVDEMNIGPVITITPEHILLVGKPVAETAPLLEIGNQEIPVLKEKLEKLVEQHNRLSRKTPKPGEPFEGKLIIQADVKQDFRVLKKVIYTANAAGWFHLNFAVTGIGEAAEGGGGEADH